MKSLISATMIVCFLILCSAHAEHLRAPGIERDYIRGFNHSDYTFDADTTELDDFIITTMEDCYIPGAAACIIKDGAIRWSGVYGWANIENSIPVANTTLFMLASISKTFTGTAVMQLWEEELFELDADVNDYLPFQVRSPHHPLSPITFQMLLTHTSSIADYWPVLNSLYVFGSDSPIPLDEFLENYLIDGGDYNYPQNFKLWSPGMDFQYSSVGVALLGYLVERITGTSFDEYCQNSIFDPLGMEQTSWFLEGLDPDNIAMPYEWNGSFYEPYGQYGFPFYPAG
jgi:CubicO group peptidase (beta-lactamase class C family)